MMMRNQLLWEFCSLRERTVLSTFSAMRKCSEPIVLSDRTEEEKCSQYRSAGKAYARSDAVCMSLSLYSSCCSGGGVPLEMQRTSMSPNSGIGRVDMQWLQSCKKSVATSRTYDQLHPGKDRTMHACGITHVYAPLPFHPFVRYSIRRLTA